ncbi:MAG: hypothetical protein KDA75_03585 [Planctomycetaceae bacterium]|nr:hypothetical protein [Planctomycetaceae bacterium]
MPDLNQLLPLLLFTLPWIIAVLEIRRGLKTGRMREYLRRDSSEDASDFPAKYCSRAREPRTFWCLFAFYVLILLLVPLGLTMVFFKAE